MTGEKRRNYLSTVLRRWKEIKEDSARLSEYNDRARRMKNKAEKPAKSGDDHSGSSMEQQMVTERFVVKKTQRQPQKASKSPEFVDTDSDDSDDDSEEQKPSVKQPTWGCPR